MSKRPTFRLTIQATPKADGAIIRDLRRFLKALGRSLGFRVESIELVKPDDIGKTDAKPTDDSIYV
jgi:hypothetical protein